MRSDDTSGGGWEMEKAAQNMESEKKKKKLKRWIHHRCLTKWGLIYSDLVQNQVLAEPNYLIHYNTKKI